MLRKVISGGQTGVDRAGLVNKHCGRYRQIDNDSRTQLRFEED